MRASSYWWLLTFSAIYILGANHSLQAQEERGDFSGTIRISGEIPDLPPLKVNGICQKNGKPIAVKQLPDESLQVNPRNQGLANAIVYLDRNPGDAELDAKPIQITCRNLRFEPRVQCIQVMQEVRVTNATPHAINFNVKTLRNQPRNMNLNANAEKAYSYSYSRAEKSPIQIVSDFQPWMKAWHLVIDHPYAAVTDEDGKFVIKDLPPGEHQFRVWHERAGYLEEELAVECHPQQGASIERSYPVERLVSE